MFSVNDRYIFREELLADTLSELLPMFKANHEETGGYDLPYNIDHDRYLRLEKHGGCIFIVAREKAKMNAVGYSMFFLDREIQQKELISAYQSTSFMVKEHRGASYAFMKFCDDILKKRGVNTIKRVSTPKRDVGKVYERMGYKLIEMTYARRL